MTKRQVIIAVIAGAGCISIFFLVRDQTRLREENRRFRDQVGQLATVQAQNESLSNLLSEVHKTQAATRPDAELLRLRGEVARLRALTNKLATPHTANPQADGGASTPNAEAKMVVSARLSRDSWQWTGYGSPEAAFQSILWAMSQGDMKRFRESLAVSGEEFTRVQDRPDADLGAELKSEAERVTSFEILKKEDVSEDTSILTVLGEGVNEVGKFKFQRTGQEWKLVGSGKF